MDVIGNNRPEGFLKKIKGQFSTFGTFFLITDTVSYTNADEAHRLLTEAFARLMSLILVTLGLAMVSTCVLALIGLSAG